METVEGFLTPEEIEQLRSTFTTANELSAQIVDQNERFETVQAVFAKEPDIRELAEQGIAEEQQQTFLALTEITKRSGDVYELVGHLGLNNGRALKESEDEVARLEAQNAESAHELELANDALQVAMEAQRSMVVKLIEELSPRAVEPVKRHLEKVATSATTSDEIRELDRRVQDLLASTESELVRIDATKDITSQLARRQAVINELDELTEAWAVPVVLLKVLGSNIAQYAAIDEMPVEPQLNPRGHNQFNALRERYAHQPEASIYAALYLTSHQGEIVTVEDIAGFLYSDSVRENMSTLRMRNRITTLLGPNREYVDKILLEEGYILQYGWRKILEKNDSGEIKIKTTHRIYRAISLDNLEALQENTFKTERYRDEFEVPDDLKSLIAATDAEQSAPVVADIDQPPMTMAPEPPDDAIVKQEREKAWIQTFKNSIGRVLNELEEQGLLVSKDGVSIKVLRTKTTSRLFATDTSLEKAIEAGHLSTLSSSGRGSWPSEILTPSELVILRLFKTNQRLLGKKQPNKNDAIRIIAESVDAYFAHKEQEK